MSDPADKHKHLEFIQQAIARMSTLSSQLKGWSVSLVTAILAFAAAQQQPNPAFVLLALFPALVFWGLDGYYLRLERLYRALYDAARKDHVEPFSLDFRPHDAEVSRWFGVTVSFSLLAFHGAVVVAILAVLLVLAR